MIILFFEWATLMDMLDDLARRDLAVGGRIIAMSSLYHTKALEDEFWRTVTYLREKNPEA